ncbi:MAG: hypothetical protein ABIA12_02555 [Candidatus Aenigmatarchaeota archaeon]
MEHPIDIELAKYGLHRITVGDLENPPSKDDFIKDPVLSYKSVKVNAPYRLCPTVFDMEKLTVKEEDGLFNYGELAFTADGLDNTLAEIKVRGDSEITVYDENHRESILLHTAEIIRKALETKEGLDIKTKQTKYRHVGLGSSASLGGSVARGILELYGMPMKTERIPHFLACNYGEEDDFDRSKLVPVQSHGATATSQLYGGAIAVWDHAKMLGRSELPPNYTFIMAIPEIIGYESPRKMDGSWAYYNEILHFPSLKRNGQLLKDVLAEGADKIIGILNRDTKMSVQSLNDLGKVLMETLSAEDYKLCSRKLIHPRYKELVIENFFRFTEEDYCPLAFISSVGPGVALLVEDGSKEEVKSEIKGMKHDIVKGMNTLELKPNNKGSIVDCGKSLRIS